MKHSFVSQFAIALLIALVLVLVLASALPAAPSPYRMPPNNGGGGGGGSTGTPIPPSTVNTTNVPTATPGNFKTYTPVPNPIFKTPFFRSSLFLGRFGR